MSAAVESVVADHSSYHVTLAAQADVLVAAKAWPLLTKSLSDLTDIPGRHQLAIVSSPPTRKTLAHSAQEVGLSH